MTKRIYIIFLTLIIVACSTKISLAQERRTSSGGIRREVPDQNKVAQPEDSPEQRQKEKDELDEDKKKLDPNKPLTKRQQRREAKKLEKEKKRAYKEHHDKIQTKPVRKDMKKKQKKAHDNNINKRPTIFKKIKVWFKKKKKQRRK